MTAVRVAQVPPVIQGVAYSTLSTHTQNIYSGPSVTGVQKRRWCQTKVTPTTAMLTGVIDLSQLGTCFATCLDTYCFGDVDDDDGDVDG